MNQALRRIARPLTVLLFPVLVACTPPALPSSGTPRTSDAFTRGASHTPSPKKDSIVCAFDEPATVLLREGPADQAGSRLLQYWEVANTARWWSEAAPVSASYKDFHRRVADKVSLTDPVRLLERSPTPNNKLVIADAATWIRPASCLEKLLQAEQHARINIFLAPTEFLSFILRSPDGARLRIYYYTVNYDGIGAATPVSAPVVQAHQEGWVVLAGLHNHGFHPGQPLLDGLLAPSAPDANFNLNFATKVGMQEAWITNGLHSVHIPASQFSRFERE